MKFTTSISKMKSEFSLSNATHVGGSKIFLAYLEKIKFIEALNTLNHKQKSNTLFPLHRILLYLIIGWTLGCERLFHFRLLQKDSLLCKFLGGRCPHHTLLGKQLYRLGHEKSTFLTDLKRLNQQVIMPSLPDQLILDLDSTVETVYGNQQGAKVGVNAHKPGRKSYHPILAFEGQSRLYLNAALRSGNVHSSRDAESFVEETLSLLGDRPVKYARFDKGFGGEDFYRVWESRRIGYVGKCKWTKRLQAEVSRCRYWNRFVDDDWVIEGITLIYQATSWQRPRQVVVIRKAEQYYDDQLQMILESDWQYEAMVTNLDWQPIDIWRFYNQRACMENYIKEAKHGFSIHRIATGNFRANEIDLLTKLLAYNLYERFKKDCCEPVQQGYTIRRFRQEFFYCAATIVHHSRQAVLKLAKSFANRHAWKRIETRVTTLE